MAKQRTPSLRTLIKRKIATEIYGRNYHQYNPETIEIDRVNAFLDDYAFPDYMQDRNLIETPTLVRLAGDFCSDEKPKNYFIAMALALEMDGTNEAYILEHGIELNRQPQGPVILRYRFCRNPHPNPLYNEVYLAALPKLTSRNRKVLLTPKFREALRFADFDFAPFYGKR
jgi:hypothetical protein